LRPAAGGSTPPAEEAPVSSFTGSPESGTAPLAVSFTDTSTGSPTSWAWDFGDETRSTEQNPTHTFTAGTYTVSLTVANAHGSSAPATRTIEVTAPATTPPTGHVSATVETAPTSHSGDSADDPAIWINPQDPAASTVIATDKQGALLVYDLQGQLLQSLPVGRVNNVDLRDGFVLGGVPTSLVTFSNRTDNTIGIHAVDPETRLLRNVATQSVATGMPVLGACMYRSPGSGTVYAFVTSEAGAVQQWELSATEAGTVDATMVRSFSVGSMAEGCVADDEQGILYLAEESVGIWRYGAEPTDAVTGTLIAGASQAGPLVPTIEGLTIAYGPSSTGYLIASSQGDGTFAVYARDAGNSYVGSFDVVAGNGIDGVSGTDGIDVTTVDLGPDFPSGVFVTQDHTNEGNQNFKLVPYQQITAILP
jgi:3-phytase